ncbi:PTS cellobiose transporter subunit IIA [Clostridium saccharobutylicum]|uniref:Lichenan-specific phosphotransferase enzyme IIA component n=1 Tax=Clostridium saccharobutylicum TaxID=169679 RepID=A0A1S8MQJ5_CLOSA|nr:PTS cellobiose transporter subunit IIA [Clostridium saccharobutylicum]OOM06445.1 lichenan-specific phosphotransferase enzyme IIA component [Clostridium saccharobutylicum]
MTKDDLQLVAFEIILHSGDARTIVHEGLTLMKQGKFEEAEKKMEDANNELLEAHKSQTKLLQDYANGDEIIMEVIMVHAQDHLMTTMTLREMAIEFLAMYTQIYELKNGEVNA